MDGHDLDEPLGAARERGGRDLGDLEPAVELLGREGRADREVERELADVGDRGEHVGLAGAAVGVALEAREPTGLADGLQAHVGDGHAAHRASRPRHDLVGARQARRGLGAREELEGLEAAVDRAHGRRVERALATGAELDEVVGVEAEHLAREQREEAGARVLGVGERVQECRHDVDLGRAREGRAAAHDALEAAGPERVDVVGGVREGAEQKRHARGALAVVAVGGEAVGDHRGADGALGLRGSAGRGRSARELDVDARQVARLVGVGALGVGVEVHEAVEDAALSPADAVDEGEHVAVAAVVDRELDVALPGQALAPAVHDGDVRAAEAVDRLLDVADRREAQRTLAG